MSNQLENVLQCLQGGVPERLPVCPLTPAFDARACGLTYEDYAADANFCRGDDLRDPTPLSYRH